jgi:hypothetical protein
MKPIVDGYTTISFDQSEKMSLSLNTYVTDNITYILYN